MKRIRNIRVTLAIIATSFAIVLVLSQFLYNGFVIKKAAVRVSKETASKIAEELAQSVEVYFRDGLTLTQTFARNAIVYRQINLPRETFYKLMYSTISLNPNFLAIWTMWEPDAYDNADYRYRNDGFHDHNGSMAVAYYYQDNEIKTELNDTSDFYEDFYTIPRALRQPVILDPFYYQYHGNEKFFFETSLVCPIIDNEKFLGVIGVDLDMYALQERYNSMKAYNSGLVCLLSNSGTIVTHPDPDYIEKNITGLTPGDSFSARDSLSTGEEFVTEGISEFSGKEVIRYFFPVNIKYMAAPWYIMIEIPQDEILSGAKSLGQVLLVFLLASLILLSYLIFSITDRRRQEERLLDYINDLERTREELKIHKENLEDLVRARMNEITKLNEELLVSNKQMAEVNKMISLQKSQLEETLEQLKRTQEKLIISEKMASIGVLASGIAHEINNPLNFIHGGVQALEDYFRDHLQEHVEKVSPMFNAINTGVERSANVVKSLGHYTQTDSPPGSVCDIHVILDNCITILDNQLRGRAEVRKNYNGHPAVIRGSEGQLHQAFLNILTNALHSIERKGIITLSTLVEHGELVIKIDDTGCGISRENMDKIFDLFFTTKDPGVGTGLGLSITYSIIRDHKGTIEYRSELNVGTTAIIRFPVQT